MVRKQKSETQKPISSVAKETSGAQKRKKKLEIEEDTKKLREEASRFFKVSAEATGSSECKDDQHTSASETDCTIDGNETSCLELATEKETARSEDQIDEFKESEQPCSNESFILLQPSDECGGKGADNLDILDPSTWAQDMPLILREKILTSSAVYEFDSSVFIKSTAELADFWKKYSTGTKSNGEFFSRTWMRVSKTTSSVFCMPCCLFWPRTTARTSWANIGDTGFSDFGHSSRAVSRHEESSTHLDSMRRWKHYTASLENPNSLASIMSNQLHENVSEWRKVLRGVVDAVFYLAQNNLAFRGHTENMQDSNCGNFLNLIKLLAKYYSPLSEHLDRLKKRSVSYLSPQIQNEFILLLGRKVRDSIITDVQQRKYFSILFDATPDVSRLEQISQIVRSVECSKSGCVIHENFVDFISSVEKSGAGLTDVILSKLNEDSLDIANCRGQGYDNGSNMSGCYSGVQARIQNRNSCARFVPCAAHSLNLVGVNAAEKVLPGKLLLGVIQNVYDFFASSPARCEVLTSKTTITLKCQSRTRWSSKARAVTALKENYSNVLEALLEIIESDRFNSDASAGAESKLRDLNCFKNVLGTFIWSDILFQINVCNVHLQNKGIDLSVAEKHLNVLIKWLKTYKTNGFEEALSSAKSFAVSNDIDVNSGFENVRRGRGINPKYDDPERITQVNSMSNLERFKQEFFIGVMEKLIDEMSNRFKEIRLCNEDFGFLWGDGLKLGNEEKIKCVKDICSKYPEDLCGTTFLNEIQSLHLLVEEFSTGKDLSYKTPLDVLNLIYRHELESTYSNCSIALRIFLTMPVSVASNERAFSKLKLIKNYLRSSMGQERLSGLTIISIEREKAATLDVDDIINDFVAKRVRKVF